MRSNAVSANEILFFTVSKPLKSELTINVFETVPSLTWASQLLRVTALCIVPDARDGGKVAHIWLVKTGNAGA